MHFFRVIRLIQAKSNDICDYLDFRHGTNIGDIKASLGQYFDYSFCIESKKKFDN